MKGLEYSAYKTMLKITDLCNALYYQKNKNEIDKIIEESKNG